VKTEQKREKEKKKIRRKETTNAAITHQQHGETQSLTVAVNSGKSEQ